MILYDESGKIVKINKAGLRIFKLTEEEAFKISADPHLHFDVYDMSNQKVPLNKRPGYRLVHNEKLNDEKYIVGQSSYRPQGHRNC